MRRDDESEARKQIAAWADAHAEVACEPITDEELERADAALAKVGFSISALQAWWARLLWRISGSSPAHCAGAER
jgi:hypothetical protein